MATEIKSFEFTAEASADLSASQYRAVVIDSNGQAAVAGAGLDIDGILQNKPDAAGKAATILALGISKVEAGAAVTRGANVTGDASGRVIDAAGVSGDFIWGRALDAASGAGEFIRVLIRSAGRAA